MCHFNKYSVKNNVDTIIFYTTNCFRMKQVVFMAGQKSLVRNRRREFLTVSSQQALRNCWNGTIKRKDIRYEFIRDNNTWYYLNASGAMLKDTSVDGYRLGSNGAWIR